jgi:hypothetical protein
MRGFECKTCFRVFPTSQGVRTHYTHTHAKNSNNDPAVPSDSSDDSSSDSLSDSEQGNDVNAGSPPPAAHSHDDSEPQEESLRCQPDNSEGLETDAPHVCDDLGIDMPDDRSGKEEEGGKKRKTVWIEEVEDEDDEDTSVWVEDYPEAGAVYSKAETKFHAVQREQLAQGQAPWHPFKDADEWELARWMMKSKTSGEDKDEYLKLKSVSTL